MRGLGGSTLHYIFGDELSGGFSAEFSLFVPPARGRQPPPSKGRGTTLVLYDDLGRGTTDDVSAWLCLLACLLGRPTVCSPVPVGIIVIINNVFLLCFVGQTFMWDPYGGPSILTTMAVGALVAEGRVDGARCLSLLLS